MARTKFNVDKDVDGRTLDGVVFDSALELRYYRDVLLPLVESGDVVEYELQRPYELQPKFVHPAVAKIILKLDALTLLIEQCRNWLFSVLFKLECFLQMLNIFSFCLMQAVF